MNFRSACADRTTRSQNELPERVTRLLAGNRAPGVEARLLFPGWGPKLWEKVATPESEPRERRSGGE